MRSDRSEVKGKRGRARSLLGLSGGSVRKSALRRLSLEDLEPRQLLTTFPEELLSQFPKSTLPAPVVPLTGQVSISNPTPSNRSDESAPSIAVNKANPLKLAAVWTRNDPQIQGVNHIFVEGATSSDGGLTWTPIGSLGLGSVLIDPSTSNPVNIFAQQTDASVAFDRDDNFYVLTSNHQANTGTGSPNALALSKFDFSGALPQVDFLNNVVYQSTQDQALSPTLAVDDNLASFTDTDANGQPYVQSDPFAGNVYIAWATNDLIPQNVQANNWNPNRILMIGSSNGGVDFSGPVVINDQGNSPPQRAATPRLAISQGRPKNTAVYGPNDQGVPGGQVTVVYDDFGSQSQANPPVDLIRADRLAGAASVVFNGTGGAITDASAGTPPVITPTDFTVNVDITNPNFTTLSDLSVDLTIRHPAVNELRIVLFPPSGSGLQPITLQGGGATGANFGIQNAVNGITTFSDAGARTINNQASTAPYMGVYRAQGGLFRSFYSGASVAQLNGIWTLEVTDVTNNNVGNLLNWALKLTSGMDPGFDTTVATTDVRGAMTGPFPITGAVTAQGIGPDISIASDNTLGAFSPYQGRLYVAYVDRYRATSNPADNTDIFLMVSDDGGLSWAPAGAPGQRGAPTPGGFNIHGGKQVNDDLAVKDGFSEANSTFTFDTGFGSTSFNALLGRPQFQPEVQVDQATGSVVLSWLDARNDAARARVATYLAASNDGGQTYAPQVFANRAQVAFDAITGETVNLGPIPDNQSGGNANTDAVFGFGTHQGLAVYGGKIHPIWASNENSDNRANNRDERLDIRTVTATMTAGPRIIDSTMGAVGLPGDTVNPSSANGAPTARAFQVTFDRPVDPLSFTPAQVQVFFRDTTPTNVSGGLVPVVSVVPISTPSDPNNPNNIFGFTQFQVNFAPRTAVGTYSYIISPTVHDRIRNSVVTVTPSPTSQTFTSTDVPKNIPDQFVTTSVLPISGFTSNQVIANVTVNLTINHTFDADLILILVAPDGTQVVLSNQNGGSGDNYINTTFDDGAATSIVFGSPPFTGSFQPEGALGVLSGHAINGNWILGVIDVAAPDTGVLQGWSLNITPGNITVTPGPGNSMDQDSDGNTGEQPSASLGVGDAYAAPSPTNTGSMIWSPGQFFPGPYSQDSLPLVLTGPHVVSSHVPGAPVTPDNLVLNGTVSAIDVVFDRDMDPSSITPASIVRIIGPAGPINGPFTITANPLGTDPTPGAPRTYRIGFPAQKLSGTYTVTLASTVRSATGAALDSNLNAGVDLLRGTPTASSTPVSFPSSNVPVAISPQKTITSTLDVPQAFLAQGVTLTLNINYPFDPDLEATLIGPDGTTIRLFSGVGTTGTQQNFSNTTFDDNATTLIQNGGPPFFGRFVPQQPLSAFNGKAAGGTWTLQIKSNAPLNSNRFGSLVNWSLTFQKSVPITGLGEPVADQASVSFRIFTTDPTNPLSHTTWTPIGPAPTTNEGSGDGFGGQIGAIAVDPSDPSGNTVFVAGSSGGIWKTSNFLTTNPQGPTYIPLTDFGPSFSLNVGSIAVFARNNDPNQSIIIAGTGFGDSIGYGNNGNTDRGVGFLRSMDGGATWTLLDSTNNNLPFTAPPGQPPQFARDHLFAQTNGGQGTSTFKVVVDPRPLPNGNVIVYAALSGLNGGLWRSDDTGQTWRKLSVDAVHGTQATDIVLDLNSATIDAISNPTGNVNIIYAAFEGQGVFISPNRGQSLNLMAGNNFNPVIRDPDFAPAPAILVQNGTFPTNPGRIVLARPALVPSTDPNASVKNVLYEGWLYAAVSTADGSALQGLYLTKDNGATWTRIKLGNAAVASGPNLLTSFVYARPSNDPGSNDYNMTSTPQYPGRSNYNISVAVDPTNPSIVYLGGTSIGEDTGLIRIDTTRTYDSHAAIPFDASRPDGGQLQFNTNGRIQIKAGTRGRPFIFTGGSGVTQSAVFTNLIQSPFAPFASNTTIFLNNVNSVNGGNNGGSNIGFLNDGSGTRWTPFDTLLHTSAASATDFRSAVSTNVHRMITIVDPLTGHARLIVANDQGVFTGVDNDGTVDEGIGSQDSATFSRNGNLQTAQFFYGAAQPSTLAAQVAQAFAYGNGPHSGINASAPGVLTTGNINWTAPSQDDGIGFFGGQIEGIGVQTDQQGRGIVYQYLWPGLGGSFTDFFQVSVAGSPFISRTTGLIQTNGVSDPQWPTGSAVYANGLLQGTFTVNPIAGDQVIMSSNAGRIFSTTNQGRIWLVIADPASLDGTYAPALAYGAPDPASPGGIGNLNNFIYAGTVGGKIFVTTVGGGTTGGGNAWTDISSGLDGSPVVKIITNPTRGSHEAYAITQLGVYHTENSLAPTGGIGGAGTVWTNITGNLLLLNTPAFGNAALSDTKARYLTSIVADWRYVLPDNPAAANSPTHPVLYAAGESGVYRSLDDGQTWAIFPNMAFDKAPSDGGQLPNAKVTDLNLALGIIDPTTGRAVAQPGDPNSLLATTFGRGTFSIRLAPIVFENTPAQPNNIALHPSSAGGTTVVGGVTYPLVSPNTARPIINGFSEQTAFGNSVFITLYDLADPNNPRIIGGFDPANPATAIAANQTDSFGRYSIQVNQAAFTANGLKHIGIQATDASGTTGNIAKFDFVLQARNLGLPNPPAQPTIGLSPFDDSSHGQGITNVRQPRILGTTDPNVTVELFFSSGGVPAGAAISSGISDAGGNFTLSFPNPLPAGPVTVQVRATNSFGSTVSQPLSFTIDFQGPLTGPTLGILAADDTGIVGDGITSNRRPRFVGQTDPGAIVELFNVANPNVPLASATADGTGAYSTQLPSDLTNGSITIVARARDVAGNQGPVGGQFTLTVATVAGDYNADGRADLALYRRTSPQAQWVIQGVTSAAGVPFGVGPLDIPLEGDFNGDGRTDLAVYRPSTATWFVQGVFPASGVPWGQPNVDIPVPGDYFGTGQTSIALFRPTTGEWFVPNSPFGTPVVGMAGDIPVPGDWDGTGRDIPAVYRPSTGQFIIFGHPQPFQLAAGQIPVPAKYDSTATFRNTEPAVYDPATGVLTILGPNGQQRTVQFAAGSVPAPGDYDGVGLDQPAAYDPVTGTWQIYTAGTNASRNVAFTAQNAVPVDAPYNYRKLPVAGDYNGDGRADLALFRKGTGQWFIGGITGPAGISFGSGTKDIPLLGDFNGDGRADLAVYRPSTATWFVRGVFSGNGVQFGQPNVDLPVPADYLGNGQTTIATFRPTTGQWFIGGVATPTVLGRQGDTPVPGNYDGTGKAQIAVFRPAAPGNPTQWLILGANNVVQTIAFGGKTDVPVPGDYDGHGRTQIATYRPSTGQWFIAGHAQAVSFGGRGDIPAPGDYDGTGRTQIAVYRPSTGQLFIAGHAQPITFGGSKDIPVNAPFIYRSLSGKVSATAVTTTTKGASLNFGTQAASLSAASVSSPVKTQSAPKSTTPPPATPPVANYGRIRPKQASASTNQLRGLLLHDDALASYQTRRKP